MSQEQENVRPTDDLPSDGAAALSVLRDVWRAREQTSVDVEEDCGNTKACKTVASMGFQGLADGGDSPRRGDSPVDNDLRAAWRTKLEREGKLNPDATSIRDLVLGSAEPPQ